MAKHDRIRLRHMLESAREVVAFAHGRSRDDLDHDRMLALALVKCIEITGEAATRVSEQMRADHPTVPWADIVAMRHRLIHGYFDIDMDRVWDTVTNDLPPLITELEKIVASVGRGP